MKNLASLNLTQFYIAVVRILSIYVTEDRRVYLSMRNQTTLTSTTLLADINLSNSAVDVTSSNNLFAYRPRYNDAHGSNLAAIFINLEGVFPCIQSLSDYAPVCSAQTEEDDGFRGGKALLNTADIGSQLRIFSSSSNILTYGIAIQDCPEFTTACLHSYQSFTIVCYLPREACS